MIRIRPYLPDDQKAVLNIYALSKLDELVNEEDSFELLPLEKDSKRIEKLMESEIFVFDDQGVVGYCAFSNNEISALFVHPSFRKRGVGVQMLEFMLDHINETPFLYVVKSNTQAKKIYNKYGFKIVDEFITEYNGKSVIANKMCRKITS